LAQAKIRLEYSGFVIFLAKIVSVLSGFLFQIMVADALMNVRAGGKTEHDLWFNINDISTYFLLMGGVLSFWAMRFVARGKEGAVKTGIVANLAIAGVSLLVFLPLIPVITSSLGIGSEYLLVYYLISLQLVEIYSITMLESCLQARMPQAIGYGLLVQQACRVILGYLLVVRLNMLLLGAVVTTIVAFAFQIFYYLKLFAAELRQKVRWEYVKEWFKGSLANVYYVCGNQVATIVFFMLLYFGGEGARGRYGAAGIVANVITYSSFLAYALYPKLLSEGKQQDVAKALKMVLMFAIPMTVGAIVLSGSYMIMFSTGEQAYTDAGPVLVVLAMDAFVMAISSFLSWLLFGVESVDEKSKISLHQLARSRLFVYFSLPYLHSFITIPTTLYFLTNHTLNQPLQSALYVSIINTIARFVMFLILCLLVRKMTRIDVPWMSAAKYLLAASIMGLTLFLVPHTAQRLLILVETAIGGVVYMVVLLTIDDQTRKLFRAALHEVKRRVRKT